ATHPLPYWCSSPSPCECGEGPRTATPDMSESTPTLAEELAEALDLSSDADGRAAGLFRQFLASGTYSRPLALSLIDVAQGRRGDSWEVRGLATLMLQEPLLALPAGRLAEFRFILGRLGLTVGGDGRMPAR